MATAGGARLVHEPWLHPSSESIPCGPARLVSRRRPAARNARTEYREGLLGLLDARCTLQRIAGWRSPAALQRRNIAVEGIRSDLALFGRYRYHGFPRRPRTGVLGGGVGGAQREETPGQTRRSQMRLPGLHPGAVPAADARASRCPPRRRCYPIRASPKNRKRKPPVNPVVPSKRHYNSRLGRPSPRTRAKSAPYQQHTPPVCGIAVC